MNLFVHFIFSQTDSCLQKWYICALNACTIFCTRNKKSPIHYTARTSSAIFPTGMGPEQICTCIPLVSEPKRNSSKMQLFQTGSLLPARMAAMARPIRLDQQDCLTLSQVIQGDQSRVVTAFSLQILRSFSAPITEEHAWAVIHQVCESCHLDHIFCGL